MKRNLYVAIKSTHVFVFHLNSKVVLTLIYLLNAKTQKIED